MPRPGQATHPPGAGPGAPAAETPPSDQALAALRKAAEAAPGDAALWTRYVYGLRLAGKKARARKAVEQARVAPAQRRMLKDIAEGRSGPVDDIAAMIRQGALAAAWQAGVGRLAQFPKDHRLLNLLGVAALADDDPARAAPVLRRAVAADPGYDPARANLGLALMRQGRTAEAMALLEPRGRDPKASLDVRINLASALQKLERFAEAEALTGDLMALASDDPELLGIRGKALIGLDRAVEARSLLGPLAGADGFGLHDVMAEAIGATDGIAAGTAYLAALPDQSRDAEIRIASLLAEWGALDTATARLRRLAARVPADPQPVRLIGLFTRWEAGDPLIAAMEKGLAAPDLAPAKRGAFGLALAKAHMDAGQDDAAMAALDAGNGLLRGLIDYDVADDEAEMAQIARCWTAEAIAAAGTGPDRPAPIFIVGLPRSGSTLLETILSRHPEIVSLGESPLAYDRASAARTRPDPARVAGIAEDLRPMLAPGPGRRAVTDKLLANFLNAGVLAAAFPGARFVEMRRDYRATCLSIYQADLGAAAHPYAMDQRELGRYAAAYDRLMAHWAGVLGPRLLRVDYHALATAPEAEIRQLLSALDLDWHADCLRPEESDRRINTMSVGQARKPISTGSLTRWRRFETGLGPLIETLEAGGAI